MAPERRNWVRDKLRELGIEDHEADAARQSLVDLVEKANAEKRELQEKLADLTRRVEKLENRKLEQGK